MSKKDYQLIANALMSVRPSSYTGDEYTQWKTDMHAVAGALASANPRFDYEQFIEACYK